jgi:catechol 2,3-dioxygenase-like lactoylglutathione lyase family enzyme
VLNGAVTNLFPEHHEQDPSADFLAARSRRFDHVGLSVPDLDAATAFFVNCFAARVLFTMARPESPGPMGAERLGLRPETQFALVMLELGGSRIELLQWWPARGDPSAIHADHLGVSHVAVEVEDVTACLESLRVVSGVEVLSEPLTFAAGATPGLTNAFLRTPWGAIIELVAWNWPDI